MRAISVSFFRRRHRRTARGPARVLAALIAATAMIGMAGAFASAPASAPRSASSTGTPSEPAQTAAREMLEEVGERDNAPPYSRRLWQGAALEWARAVPAIERDLAGAWQELRRQATDRFWALAALLLAWAGALRGIPWLVSKLIPRLPEGRIRRSLPALLRVAGTTVCSAALLIAIGQVLGWGTPTGSPLPALLAPLIGVLAFAAFMASLGRNVLSCGDAGLRLPDIPDEVAARMRHVPWLLAGSVAAATWLEILVVRWLPAQGYASRLAIAGVVVFLAAVLASVWSRLGLALRANPADAPAGRHRVLLRGVVVVGWALILGSLFATLLGYYGAGGFLIKQTLWGGVVLVFTYLLAAASGDTIDAYLGGGGRAGRVLAWRLGLEPRKVDQVGAIVYGVVRLLLLLCALVLLAAPYGLGPSELFGRLHPRTAVIAIGQLRLGAGDLVRALLVFAAVMLATRLFGRWFNRRYLPTTRLDPGMRSSLVSVATYVGVVIAISMALAAMGVGLDKITWIASALTVGIGFGLQAIVQNFISGLILLAERPVRVGDWVVVGDAEGDVRRINVRATEITMADRTTVLVPNSELITKVVRNRTLTRSEGLVKILLPLPAATTDVEKAVAVAREVISANSDVLPRPEPVVLVEEVKDNKIFFNLSVYVDGPRRVATVRGALLYELLRRLPEAGVPLA
ncbi:mechanosensitive ion channel [Pseudomonas sp. R2.Fl]|nr:mechanosensitive ion channel [Pseudomonas sp. R2.Fl]